MIKHTTVFSEPNTYAGWPANHGSWQWGDEFLVGFIRGRHNIGGMHNVIGPLEKVQARSKDGGETWTVEVPNVDFEARTEDIQISPPVYLPRVIIRVCGNYDHGGENCDREGAFYFSHDRGKRWEGPFATGLPLASHQQLTSRTCVSDDLIFFSAANKNHWGSDFVFCAKHNGERFIGRSIVFDDEARAVMPAAARVNDRIVVAMRRRGLARPGGWIDSVYSDDNGHTWSSPVFVAETGKDNGNPPALIMTNKNLYCAYANRSRCTIEVMKSENSGISWIKHAELRKGEAPDIGYPRLFKRSDGKLVCVYYWTDYYEEPQSIQATVFEP